MAKAITRTRSYRHLMTIMGNAGIVERQERLDIARKILNKHIQSYKDLTSEDVDILIQHFESWRHIQEQRFTNGTLQSESLMVTKMLDASDMLTLSDKTLLSTRRSRSAFMDRYHITEEDYKTSVDNLSDILAAATSGLDVKERRLTVDRGRWPSWKCIPAPTVGLGLATNIGGIPRGKITHIWGQKHGGKSYLTFAIIAEAQKQGIPCVLLDTEAAATGSLVEDLGVDLEHLAVYNPKDTETACTMLRELSKQPVLVVVDSIASSESSVELDRNITKDAPRVAGNAQLWKSTLSIARANLLESGGAFILVNQVRKNFNAGMYGNPDKPYGADAIFHSVDLSICVRAAKETNATLDKGGYKLSKLSFDKNRFGEMHSVSLSFKPGFPYNKSIDLVRVSSTPIGKGSAVPYGELAGNAIVAHMVPDTTDPTKLLGKKNRWSIRIDPYLLAAIRMDDPDFAEVDVEPLEDFDTVYAEGTIPPVDEENSEYFALPGVGELNAAKWLNKHKVASRVIGERILNSLEHLHDALDTSKD